MIVTLYGALIFLKVFSVEGEGVKDSDGDSSGDVSASHGEEAAADEGPGVRGIEDRSCGGLQVDSSGEVRVVFHDRVRSIGLVD